MPRPLVTRLCLCAIVVVAFTACGTGQTTTPQVICITSVAPDALVFPQNGAANVPDGNFTLVLAYANAPVSLQTGGTIVASNLPATTTTLSGAGYAVPALARLTTYQVIAPTPLSGCVDANHPPPRQMGIIGSFTTQ